MEKRALIAVVLSVAVFYIFSAFFGPQQKAVTQTAPASVTTENVGAAPAVTVQQALDVPKFVAGTAPTASLISVETDRYIAVFSPAGGSLKSLMVKGFSETNKPSSPNVVLLDKADPSLFSFSTRGVGFALSPQALYRSNVSSLHVPSAEKKQLIFTYVDVQGYVVHKTYSFDGSGYGISLDTRLVNNSGSNLAGAFQHVLTAPFDVNQNDGRYETYGSSIYSDNGLHTDAPKNLASASKKYDKDVQWAGINDKYFLSALISVNKSVASVELKKNSTGFIELAATTAGFSVAPGQAVTVSHKIFVGPKEIDTLKAQGASLEQSLDLGWFSVLAKPMLYSLKFFYKYVHNYGLAIIIITVILKIFFFPLTHKSYKSMKGMSNLQPKMAALREKYKNDKDAMNRAVMELYRDHKVNPLGGCLPMVVQIPVFFALYKALMYSIELRHAPFMFWITDLSDKDPYYVTPVIMGVTMFIQQKMTPSNMDAMQQKIMLGLPVIFTFMFLNFPSGLVMYWLVNNVLTIGQQMYINKLVKD
jgi:YidC/Oxa1 family membrane protein insertase